MNSKERLELFLYKLLRDKVPSADIVECVKVVEQLINEEKTPVYTSKHLAAHASELADRILEK
jgi:hypothetical protein